MELSHAAAETFQIAAVCRLRAGNKHANQRLIIRGLLRPCSQRPRRCAAEHPMNSRLLNMELPAEMRSSGSYAPEQTIAHTGPNALKPGEHEARTLGRGGLRCGSDERRSASAVP